MLIAANITVSVLAIVLYFITDSYKYEQGSDDFSTKTQVCLVIYAIFCFSLMALNLYMIQYFYKMTRFYLIYLKHESRRKVVFMVAVWLFISIVVLSLFRSFVYIEISDLITVFGKDNSNIRNSAFFFNLMIAMNYIRNTIPLLVSTFINFLVYFFNAY